GAKQARRDRGYAGISDEDEIALDYKAIQDLFGTDFYNMHSRQEVFNKFLKKISL
ncbi:hypothetical protein HKBW3S25_01959, partial [Candidatus Hakubella thermalkaliphila]